MNRSKFLAVSLLAATALAGATPAAAQRVDRIVALGDSLTDTGNAFRLGVPPQPVYPQNRFSNGNNYVDQLAALLGVQDLNFAIGGAKTNNTNTIPGLPGFTYEYTTLLAGGGGPAFPTIGGFQPNDLVVLSIGGNDARTYDPSAADSATNIAPLTAAANVKLGLDALVNAGAPAITYLALDTSRAPEVAGNAAARAVRTAYATTFNGALKQTFAGYAARGVIVNYLDLNLVGDRIIANPAAFGLVSAGACNLVPITRCIGAEGNAYLFYIDQLHFTEGGYAIIAKYAWRQTQAPLGLQATSDMEMNVAHQFGRTLTARMDLGSPRDGDTLTGARVFVIGDTSSVKVDSGNGNDAFRATTTGVTAGIEFGFGSGTVGIAGNYSKPKSRMGNQSARTTADSGQVGAFGSFGIAGGFVQAYAGYGKDHNDITRAGVIDSLAATANGHHWLAGAKAGYLMPMGTVRVGPVVALDYAKAHVNGYNEAGDAALALNVGAIDATAMRASGGIELRGDFGGQGIHLSPFAAATVEADIKGDRRSVVYREQAAPTIVNHFAFDDVSKHPYARIGGGFSAAILSNMSLGVSGSATIGKRQGDETSANLGFSVGF